MFGLLYGTTTKGIMFTGNMTWLAITLVIALQCTGKMPKLEQGHKNNRKSTWGKEKRLGPLRWDRLFPFLQVVLRKIWFSPVFWILRNKASLGGGIPVTAKSVHTLHTTSYQLSEMWGFLEYGFSIYAVSTFICVF